METLWRLADRLDEAATAVGAARLSELDPGHPSGGGAGAPAEVATALRRQVAAALQARGEEAAALANGLGDLAARVRTAAGRYRAVEEAVRSRRAGQVAP
ncbi:MAG TPA: hypothetical protein VKY81_07105 [Natronosporangium sp.]|nr:hypothetical protein [Natronosporangium sp.]